MLQVFCYASVERRVSICTIVFPRFMWTRFFADYSLMDVSNGKQSIEISLDINRLIGVIFFSNEYSL